MDELDIRIVRELTHSRHEGIAWGELSPSYREIGRRLGYSRGTIRERVERLYSSGFLRVFPVQVNPSLLGFTIGAMAVDVPPSADKSDLMQKLSMVQGMLIIAAHVGTLIGLIFYYEDEPTLLKKTNLVARICDATDVKVTAIPYPLPMVQPSAKDWLIVDALQRKWPGRPKEIADELGISARTLKRRTKRLIDGMVISTIVSADANRLPDGVIANLEVTYVAGADRERTDMDLIRQLDSRLLYIGLWTSYSLLSVILPSIHAGSELLERVRRTKGIAGARLDFLQDRMEVYSTLREGVQRRLREASAEPLDAEVA